MPFSDHLASEIARLEAELEALPSYQMLRALKAAATLVPKVYGPERPEDYEPWPPEGSAEAKRTQGRRLNPARQQALEVALEVLKGREEPLKTAGLLEFVVQRGIELGGNDPQNNLSALLYHSDLFQSHGRRGWTLKSGALPPADAEPDGEEEEEEEEEEDDVTPALPVSSVLGNGGEPPPVPKHISGWGKPSQSPSPTGHWGNTDKK